MVDWNETEPKPKEGDTVYTKVSRDLRDHLSSSGKKKLLDVLKELRSKAEEYMPDKCSYVELEYQITDLDGGTENMQGTGKAVYKK